MDESESYHVELDRRSLEMHRLIAAKIRANPALLARASNNIERWHSMSKRGPHHHLVEWAALIEQGMDVVLAFATEDSEHATELRQSSPFAGILTQTERLEFLRQWREAHPRKAAPKIILPKE
ncbi:hypothetical protein [Caballeronia grimmiae]|uniref:hypothetical protein n=1 Tax=Caballeronia grimmiae TaxID=1071679 RepID=UPI0038B6C3FB